MSEPQPQRAAQGPSPGLHPGFALDPRKAAILMAIVREFVEHGEPVGSKRIVDAYDLGVSAATVRNEMAALEEAGLITQPHTSAGRVPTDQGYRFFVDSIKELRPLGENQRLALRGFLMQARDLEDLLRRTTRVLSQLTRYVALVVAPALDRSRLRLVQLVSLTPQTVLVLLIADTGRVEKRILDVREPVTEDDLSRARTYLNEVGAGLRMADFPAAVRRLAEAGPPDLHDLLTQVAGVVSDDLVSPPTERVFVGGQAALTGQGGFDVPELHRVFELLEEQVTLSRVMAESAMLDHPLIRIGGENEPIEGLRAASIVATGYGEEAPGSLGVLGPTRMDYPAVLAAVKAVADHLQTSLRSLIEA